MLVAAALVQEHKSL